MDTRSQSPTRLLIVEDDEATSTRLLDHFSSPKYVTTTVSDADAALRYLLQPPGYDVVLLSVTLPGKSGFDLLDAAEQQSIEASFLLLSDQDCLADKLHGFDLGADDYIVTPCALEELEARIYAVQSRRSPSSSTPNGPQVYDFDDLTINVASHTCVRGGRRISLTSLEFEILSYLVEHRGDVVPRDELRDAVWGSRNGICLRTIDRHVAKIREKLEYDPERPAYLQTVYGKGYEFACVEYA